MKLSEYIAQNGDKEVSQEELNKLLGIKESKVWKPNKQEKYWRVSTSGDVDNCTFTGSFDFNYYALGNCYKTKEEAIFARGKKLFEVKMERYLRENEDEEVDWKNGEQDKYKICYCYASDFINISLNNEIAVQGNLYTTNIKALNQFIKDNEQDIKKYLFGVK